MLLKQQASTPANRTHLALHFFLCFFGGGELGPLKDVIDLFGSGQHVCSEALLYFLRDLLVRGPVALFQSSPQYPICTLLQPLHSGGGSHR